jgi:uncharacterized protein (TIGR00369 family)
MLRHVHHCSVIGLELVSARKGFLALQLPWQASLVGDPETGVIHGGALTTLMDTVCGFVVPLSLDAPAVCPTLDLRIDYMRPARPRETVIGEAEVYRITENVIFSRGIAHQGDRDAPVAHCVATFMRLDPDVVRVRQPEDAA